MDLITRRPRARRASLIRDGDRSPDWRVAFVESATDVFPEGWLRRTDRWPHGITIRPDEDPAEIRKTIAAELSIPTVVGFDGAVCVGVTYRPDEIRLTTIS